MVEGLLAHVLLARWSEPVAWLWTGLTALGVLWLLAYGRALATRPVTVTPCRLYLRSGLHWTGSTPLGNVIRAREYSAQEDRGLPSIAIDVVPNVVLTFRRPVRLLGMYWGTREVEGVALHVDDPEGFLGALASRASP